MKKRDILTFLRYGKSLFLSKRQRMNFRISFYKKTTPSPKIKNEAQIARIIKMGSMRFLSHLDMDIRAG